MATRTREMIVLRRDEYVRLLAAELAVAASTVGKVVLHRSEYVRLLGAADQFHTSQNGRETDCRTTVSPDGAQPVLVVVRGSSARQEA